MKDYNAAAALLLMAAVPTGNACRAAPSAFAAAAYCSSCRRLFLRPLEVGIRDLLKNN